MKQDVRKRIGDVLTDYRDGLLDGLEEAIDQALTIVHEPIEVTTLEERLPRYVTRQDPKRQ